MLKSSHTIYSNPILIAFYYAFFANTKQYGQIRGIVNKIAEPTLPISVIATKTSSSVSSQVRAPEQTVAEQIIASISLRKLLKKC